MVHGTATKVGNEGRIRPNRDSFGSSHPHSLRVAPVSFLDGGESLPEPFKEFVKEEEDRQTIYRRTVLFGTVAGLQCDYPTLLPAPDAPGM